MAWWAAFSLSLYWGDVLWPPGKRTRREDRALLIVRDEFRPAIPRSGCSPEPASALPADRKLKEEKLVCEVVIWLLLFTVRLSVAAEHYCRRGQIAIAIIPDALAPTGRTEGPLRRAAATRFSVSYVKFWVQFVFRLLVMDTISPLLSVP